MVRRVLMIAGEASGDLHGSGVVRELRHRQPDIDVYGIGGDNMRREGMELRVHISELSFMGFAEVVRNLRTVFRAERELGRLLETRRPDVVVLIDYPGLNLRFARKARERGIPVLYYISPQVWAWHRGRVKKMRSLVNAMKVVFPFEVELYRREGIDCEFVGHPLAERIGSTTTREDFLHAHGLLPATPLVGFFPGSRLQEIERILPVMAEAAVRMKKTLGVQIAVSVAANLGVPALRKYIPKGWPGALVEDGTYDLMKHSDAAVVTSGTATLETGWFGTPMVIVYKTSPVSYAIGRMVVDLPYIGLPNIVAGKKIVPELLQNDMTPGSIVREMTRILSDSGYAGTMRRDLALVRERLGGPGASVRVVDGILALGGGA